jgi:hypothetical protein
VFFRSLIDTNYQCELACCYNSWCCDNDRTHPPLIKINQVYRNVLTQRHYFDDISRFSSDSLDDELLRRLDATAAADKMAAMKRLLGYNAASASDLTRKDVRKLLKTWSQTSGAVGWIRGDELFSKLIGIKVCPYTDMLGCMAYYWRAMVRAINEKGERDGGVYMICFPYCKELYVYDSFTMLNSAVDLGRDLSMHFGLDFSLTVFHPKYKNAPSLFSPERHAPFPTAGLHFSKRKSHLGLPIDESYFMDKQRMNLERLFNSAAASEPNDVVPSRGDNYVPSFFSADTVVDCTQNWFMTRSYQSSSGLMHANTVEDRWFHSKATIAEEAYADVWAIVYELNQRSQECKGVVVSSVMITPRFSAFNASQWRQFAITVNAALKRITKGKMFLEIFHPEYTGSRSANNDLRRSPFPSMLICCKT